MIGGNVKAKLQTKTTVKNDIGENIATWIDYKTLTGFIDFMNDTGGRTNFNSKIIESTHVFVCDFADIDKKENELKFICNNKEYDITFIDNPMELNRHLEIFLKYVGD